MYRIIADLPTSTYEYAGNGQWLEAGGRRYPTQAAAEAALATDLDRINPRIRAYVHVDAVTV